MDPVKKANLIAMQLYHLPDMGNLILNNSTRKSISSGNEKFLRKDERNSYKTKIQDYA